MSNLTYSGDIIDDILWRSDELTDGTSDYESQALSYLNRAYRSLWMGGTEFDPKINEIWWWLKAESTITLQPTIKTGTVSVTNNSASVTFSGNITPDLMDGWFLSVNNESDVYQFSVHGGNQNSATLDSVFTGTTNTAAGYRLMKLDYDLASDTLKPIAEFHSSQDNQYSITGMSLRKMDKEYPVNLIEAGVPSRFAMVDENTVRFNKFGDDNGGYIRLDYDYLKKPSDLTNSGSEEPLLPLQYRHVLADMALYFVHMDKENTRAREVKEQAKMGLRAMKLENAARWAQIGRSGHIYPRPRNKNSKEVYRTESGLIIG